MIHHGDCIEVMAQMPANSVDAIVCDPPYGLEFMGKEWDRLASDWNDGEPANDPDYRGDGGLARWTIKRPRYHGGVNMQEWHQRWATEALRVAKPGAYLLAFGGTRTYHRLACAIEDAGWIIRDCLVWAYASGFPKSRSLLKPAWEPIVMARKPGPLRELAIDACRIGVDLDAEPDTGSAYYAKRDVPYPTANSDGSGGSGATFQVQAHDRSLSPAGRWPANVVLTDDVFREGVEGVIAPSLSGTMTAWLKSFEDSEPSLTASLASSAVPMWSPTELDGSSLASATDSAEMPAVDSATSTATRRRAIGCSVGTMAADASKSGSTASSGRTPTDQSPPDTSSTTETGTASITGSTTWNSSPEANTPAITSHSALGPVERTPIESLSDDSANWRRNSPPVPAEQPGFSRYFLITKADRAEREPVFGGLAMVQASAGDDRASGDFDQRLGKRTEPRRRRNHHPTVKPLDLMRHLVRLVTPTGGTVLDPFLGSGTTAIAAEMEGFAWIGIEKEAEYVAIAEARLQGVQRGLGLAI